MYLESPNLVYRCIMGSSRMGLHMVTFDLDLQGHLDQKWSKLAQNGLVHSITFERTYLESPNLVYRCIMGSSGTGLHMVTFDLDLQGHLGSKHSKSATKKKMLFRAITFQGLKL